MSAASPTISAKSDVLLWLACSLLIHLIGAVLIWYLSPSSAPRTPVKPNPPLRATLVYQAAPRNVPVAPPSSEQQIPDSPVALGRVNPEVESPASEKQQIAETTAEVTEPVSQPEPSVRPAQAALPAIEHPVSAQQLQQRIRAGLHAQQQQQVDQLTSQSRDQWQQQLNSPQVADPRKFNRLTEEQQRAEARKVEVNCNNTGAAVMATLSNWTGGTVTCSGLPDIDKFIDARLNREQQ